jgi:hypothetical protein
MRIKEGERIAGVLHLLETDQVASLALALPAAAHVEAHGHIAQRVEHRAGAEHVLGFLRAAKAVQHDEGGPALARHEAGRHTHDAREAQSIGEEGDGLLVAGQGAPCCLIARCLIHIACPLWSIGARVAPRVRNYDKPAWPVSTFPQSGIQRLRCRALVHHHPSTPDDSAHRHS